MKCDFSLKWLAGCPKLFSEKQFFPLWFEMVHLFSKFSWYLNISGIFDSAPWQSVCLSCASTTCMLFLWLSLLLLLNTIGMNISLYFFFCFEFLLLVAIVNVVIFSLVMVGMWKEQLHICIFIFKVAILQL